MHSNCFGKSIVVHKWVWLTFRDDEYRETQLMEDDIPFIQDELDNVTTIFYIITEGARADPESLAPARNKLCMLSYHM